MDTDSDLRRRVLRLVEQIWPGLAGVQGEAYWNGASDVAGVLYGAPAAALGLVWLAASTPWTTLPRLAPSLLVFVALLLVFDRLLFFVLIESRPGEYSDYSSGLSGLVLLTAALIFGPIALWTGIIATGLDFLRKWPGLPNTARRWGAARNLLLNLASISLVQLSALLWVYLPLGGSFPLPGLSLRPALAGLAAILYAVIGDWLLWSVYISLYGWLNSLTTEQQPWLPTLGRFFLVAWSLQMLTLPFALLGATLFVETGWSGLLFWMAGLMLVSLLAARLSQSVEASRQQSRQLERLEELSREFLHGPLEVARLQALLERHVPRMFIYARIDIRLYEGGALLHHPADEPPTGEAVWDWLARNPEVRVVDAGERLPWEPAESAQGAWLVIPITALAAEQPMSEDRSQLLGGIVVRFRAPAQLELPAPRAVLPAVQSLADLIAAVDYRARATRDLLARQRMERELELAGQIQAGFLPEALPEPPGWSLAAGLQPARETSGDFYDLFELPGERIGLVVADVADKGMGAALYMALSRTLVRTYAIQHPEDPGTALREANRRILADTRAEQFVTVFYAALDPATGELAYCNAGHNPPVLLSPDKEPVRHLTRSGMALGVLEEAEWRTDRAQVKPGDLLALYSDGVTDTQNPNGAYYGLERLERVLEEAACAGRSAARVQQSVLADLEAFRTGETQPDDITLVILRRDNE